MKKTHAPTRLTCQICHHDFPHCDLTAAPLVRPAIVDVIRQDHPDWSDDGAICVHDLNRYRSLYVQQLLQDERGELSELDREVVDSFREHDLLSENLNAEFDRQLTMGERVADKVAEFGGSWKFILCFGGIIIAWIAMNSLWLLRQPFDPYPYILLNLVLSCLAAIQAPVIMMSQNRQEDKDRMRAEHDYRVDLKAELEIRHLNAKLDLLLTHQWQRLLEIQQLQTDLMQELMDNRGQR